MGYTHYFYRPETLDPEKFKAASEDCKKLTISLNIPIQFECDDPEPPIFNELAIRFNGVNDDGHETFLVEQKFIPHYYRQEKNGKLFAFCKTARKPYDTAVTACLIILKHHFGDDFVVTSDGYTEEWQDGLNACIEYLGYGKIPFEKQRKSND